MKLRTLMYVSAVSLLLALTIPVRLAAQEGPQYTVVDMGTFGGPDAYLDWPAQVLNQSGVVTAWAATSNPDPNFPNFFSCEDLDCLYSHAFQWKVGTVTDLGTLPGGNWSVSTARRRSRSRRGNPDDGNEAL